MHRIAAALASFSICIPLAVATAQGTGEPADSRFVLDAGTHALADLIERSSKFLRRNTLYAAAELAASGPSGDLVIQQRLELDADGCEDVVSQLLFTKGLVVVPLDVERDLWEVIAVNGPRRNEIGAHALEVTPAEVMRLRQRKITLRCVVPVEAVKVREIVGQLRPFLARSGPSGGVIVGEVGGKILVEGFADQVAGVLDMLARLEQPAASVTEASEEIARAKEKALEARIAKLEKRVATLEEALARRN